MHNKLSLLQHCEKCVNCCQGWEELGSPIVSENEATIIKNFTESGALEKIISPSGEVYYVTGSGNKCSFLTEDNLCLIQSVKPLDCQCYPIKAIYKEDKIVFVVDVKCPAVKNLSKEFIENAKTIAIKSINRFNRTTYQHHLDNYIKWLVRAELLKELK